MNNLLEETEYCIKDSGHEIKDIMFIGSLDGKYSCTWREFLTLADYNYNSGFGAAKVATDLLIVFSDGSNMTRGEHGGSEWWIYCRPIILQEHTLPIQSLFTRDVGWDMLEAIHEEI